jgi:hypothetical protein
MADPINYPDTGVGPDRESPPGMPRWVKVSAIIIGVLALVVVAIMLIGGGDHGPDRHGSGADALPAAVTAELAPLAGGHG